jgi:DNA-cytosine methyltransferase
MCSVLANAASRIISKRNIDRTMPFLRRKQTGSFYTSDDLTAAMIDDLIQCLPDHKRNTLYNLRFLEPCVGAGSFVFAYLLAALRFKFTQEQSHQLINNIYVCDINADAINSYSVALRDFALKYFGISLAEDYFATHVGGGLLFNLDSAMPRYTSIDSIFGNCMENSFDIIVTNPPYKNLKAERKHYQSIEAYNADRARYATVTEQAARHLHYSIHGVNNLFKLFFEEIFERYAAKDGIISLLVPSSILTDKTCEQLRRRIFATSGIKSIKVIGENSTVVDAQQALCALLIQKNVQFQTMEVCQNYGTLKAKAVTIETAKAIDKDLGHSILILDPSEYEKLRQLKKYPKIKELSFIVNMRGELDLTANKGAIVTQNTGYPLIRGRNIGYYQLLGMPTDEFVAPSFVKQSSKRCFIDGERLICQQIANMSKERRLTFAVIQKYNVLGNTCNFIAIKENKYDIDIYFMLGLLNSSIMNWYFKIQSSNNHINNYEIACFPVPVDFNCKSQIADLAKEYIADTNRTLLLDRIDELVKEAFCLNRIEIKMELPTFPDTTAFDKRVICAITEKQEKLSRGEILNHTTFKLSKLDLEMVRSVPQGGNWKNIPTETVAKSKRLEQITKTGGRTTLYGRIDYNKPGYTITTYFNRPGNGTYIHPVHDRVLSVREAARFQTFPDSYYFCGNKTQLLNQVGNAVPPLFAYQIAKKLIDEVGCERSLDLFCGAGGMTLGFKQAGIKSVLSTDIEPLACLTLKVNNPEIPVLCGNVTQEDIKAKILEATLANNVDMLCGGPPCQGFSMAGHRLSDDPRNQLVKDFIDIVRQVKPKILVLENVEGLLTFQGGAIYRLIHDMFSEIGYNTEGRLMQTHLFGVPQKRKRVIIMCIRDDAGLSASKLYPTPVTTDEHSQSTAREAISDLESVECGDGAKYDGAEYSNFVAMLKGEVTQDVFLRGLVGNSKRQNIPKFKQLLLFG